jgi:hypothetical protein
MDSEMLEAIALVNALRIILNTTATTLHVQKQLHKQIQLDRF